MVGEGGGRMAGGRKGRCVRGRGKWTSNGHREIDPEVCIQATGVPTVQSCDSPLQDTTTQSTESVTSLHTSCGDHQPHHMLCPCAVCMALILLVILHLMYI